MDKRLYSVGIDIGGTGIKAAMVSDDGNPVARIETPTSLEGYHAVCSQLVAVIDRLTEQASISHDQIKGIGIGVPGYVNPVQGVVHESPNLGWKDVPLKDVMSQRTGLPVRIENDANAAALGELWRGAGQDVRDLVMITLGTGIGCGIIVGQQVVHGADGFAGEFGHLKMKPHDGDICVCGKKGCLETTSSGLAITKQAEAAIVGHEHTLLKKKAISASRLSVKSIFDAAKEGDQTADHIVREAAFYLGVALANLANLLNPRRIVIGGGVTAAGDYYLDRIKESYNEFALDIVREQSTIVPAQLGNDAGFMGSAWMIKSCKNI